METENKSKLMSVEEAINKILEEIKNLKTLEIEYKKINEDLNNLKNELKKINELKSYIDSNFYQISDVLEAHKQAIEKLSKQSQLDKKMHLVDYIDNCPECKVKLTNIIKDVIKEEKKKEEPEYIVKRIGGAIFKYRVIRPEKK